MTEPSPSLPAPSGMDRLAHLPVRLTVILGRARVPFSTLLSAESDMVLELDRKAGDAVDILINDQLIGRGEIVTIGDRLGVTFTEVLNAEETI